MFNDKKKDEQKFEPDEVCNNEQDDVERFKDKNIQKWKVKAFVDDVDKFENHIHHEKDSKVFRYNSKQKDTNHGAIKNVNSVEKSKNGSFVIIEIFLDSSQFSISFIENTKNWPKYVKKIERIGSFLNP